MKTTFICEKAKVLGNLVWELNELSHTNSRINQRHLPNSQILEWGKHFPYGKLAQV